MALLEHLCGRMGVSAESLRCASADVLISSTNWGRLMAIRDLFFKRQMAARGEFLDVYQYESLPQKFRVQIVHIWGDTIGPPGEPSAEETYRMLSEALARELGVFRLGKAQRYTDPSTEWLEYFLQVEQIDIALSMMELGCRYIERIASEYGYRSMHDAPEKAKEALEEVNKRFQENGVGYQYSDGEIIRIDSQLLHAEVVKPALQLLRGKAFAGAQAEFLKAHEEYRQGDTKGALTESLKALESTMKVICKKRGWPHEANATSKRLLGILFEHQLIPEYWLSHFSALKATLESGVPTARNKDSGHGQGSEIKTVPMHLAGYVLHQTAAAIVFLAEAERAFS